MADVKICDRCGKTIVDRKVRRNMFKAYYYSLFSPDISREFRSSWDLCVDCGNKLEKFLNGDELVRDAQRTDSTTEKKV